MQLQTETTIISYVLLSPGSQFRDFNVVIILFFNPLQKQCHTHMLFYDVFLLKQVVCPEQNVIMNHSKVKKQQWDVSVGAEGSRMFCLRLSQNS